MATVFTSDTASRIWAINTDTRLATSLGTTSVPMFDIAMSPSGTLYGTDGSSLFVISTAISGGLTTIRVGAGGGLPINALEFDSTGTLYGLRTAGSTLFSINTQTGVGISVGQINGQSAGDLFFVGDRLYASTLSGDLVAGSLSAIRGGGTTAPVLQLNSNAIFGLAALQDRILVLGENDITQIVPTQPRPLVWANDILPSGSFNGATVEAAFNLSTSSNVQSNPIEGSTLATGGSRITNLGVVGETAVYRIDLNGLGLGPIRFISLLDDSVISGGAGAASGIDIDFINYSTTQFTSANTAAAASGSSAFRFDASQVKLVPGFLQPLPPNSPAIWNSSSLLGTANNVISFQASTLATRDGSNSSAVGGLSLGEGGRLDINLVNPIQDGFLYVGDVGGGNDDFAVYLSSTSGSRFDGTVVLRGGSGADTILAGQGLSVGLNSQNFLIDGGLGNDSLAGANGNDDLFGGVGNDSLSGGQGQDRLTGDAGNDVLNGGTGSDTLIGGMGNDTIDGSSGRDVLTLSGNRQGYSIERSVTTSRVTVTDNVLGRDGVDVLRGVEILAFTDGELTVGPAGADFAVLALGRALGQPLTATNFEAAKMSFQASGGGAYAENVFSSRSGQSNQAIASDVLNGLGIRASTLDGGAPQLSFQSLQEALTIFLNTFPSARSQVVLNLVGLLTDLEGNSVYGRAASAFNDAVASDYYSVSIVGQAAIS